MGTVLPGKGLSFLPASVLPGKGCSLLPSPASVLPGKGCSLLPASVLPGKGLSLSPPQNPKAILIENRDVYMINPCSAHISFVVELCQTVSV